MEAVTGTRDQTYDLVAVLYHMLQGAETFVQYIEDAERAGDPELAAFFRELLEAERLRANRAKGLLKERLGRGSGAQEPATRAPRQAEAIDDVEQASIESFPASDSPQNY